MHRSVDRLEINFNSKDMVAEDFLEYSYGPNPFTNNLVGKTEFNLKKQNEKLLNFAYIVSHDLRSHSGNLSMLLKVFKESDSENERKQVFQYVVSLADQLSETVKNLGTVVLAQESPTEEFETINIREKVEKTTTVLTAEIQKYFAKIHNYISPLATIDYVPAYIESILLNIMSNAIKYRHPERDPEISFHVSNENDFLILQMSDNGRGIDLQKYGHKLFGKHQTFHGNKDAKGIGLYITKKQIDSLGGKIEVDSKVGVGTTFKIFFRQAR